MFSKQRQKGGGLSMASIRDVARHAGVSAATVSHILSGDVGFKVTEATRQRVLDSVRALGYQYTSRRHEQEPIRLGFVLPLMAKKYSDPFFMSILSAVEEECHLHNASVTAIHNYLELEQPEILRKFCAGDLKGVILCEMLPPDILATMRQSIPHIVAADLPYTPFDCVGFDYYDANMQVMDLLLRLGYRRIAYIGGGTPGLAFERSVRMTVYRDALFCAGIPYDPALVCNCNWDFDMCQTQAQALMELPDPPDVIFAGNDSLAVIVLNTLYKMGLHCPEDVGVIGFNNQDISAHTFPPLTTVNIPEDDIGRELAQRVLRMIDGAAGPMRTTMFPTSIIQRESLRDMNKEKKSAPGGERRI